MAAPKPYRKPLPPSQWHRVGEPAPELPNVEVFYQPHTNLEKRGWHWWSIEPGVLPALPPKGPFDTDVEALEDAISTVLK
jgi:hypothetical protein